jgi:hypothetical protein
MRAKIMIATRAAIAIAGVWFSPSANGELTSAGKRGMGVEVERVIGEPVAVVILIVGVASDFKLVATREDNV